MGRGSGVLSRLVSATVLVSAVVIIGISSSASAETQLKIPGNFVYVSKVVADRCLWGIGVEFPSVPGANGYSVRYYDGYYHGFEEGSVPSPVPAADRQGSMNYLGITGGGGPAPCVADVTSGGRFTKPPIVYASFPGKAPDVGAISGLVTDKDGNPVGGVKVTISGPTHASAESGPGGLYFVVAKKGSYHVVPDATALKGTSVSPKDQSVLVQPHVTAKANFVVDGGLSVELTFAKYAVPANGTSIVTGKVTTTLFGKPAPGTNVELTVDPTDISSSLTTAPKVTVCGTSGRIWPTGPNVTDLSDVPVTVTTDAKGVYDFSLTVGTRAGSWDLDAWAKNQDGQLSSNVEEASQTKTLSVTAASSPLALNQFVTEIDALASTNLIGSYNEGSPPSLQQLLASLYSDASSGVHFGGLSYSVGVGAGGVNLVIAPATTQFTIDSNGEVKLTGPVLSSLIIDPSEWTGANLPSKLGNVGSLQSMMQGGNLTALPTVAQWLQGATVTNWHLGAQTNLKISTNSLVDFGWAYQPPGSWPAGYCN